MLLIVTLCAAVASGVPTKACDRIAQPIDKCPINKGVSFEAQSLIAEAGIYDGTQKIHVDCIENKK